MELHQTEVVLVGVVVVEAEVQEDLQHHMEHRQLLLLATEHLMVEAQAGVEVVEERPDRPVHMAPRHPVLHPRLTELPQMEEDRVGAGEVVEHPDLPVRTAHPAEVQVGVEVVVEEAEGHLLVTEHHHHHMGHLLTEEDRVGAVEVADRRDHPAVMEHPQVGVGPGAEVVAVEVADHRVATELHHPHHHLMAPPLAGELLVGVGEVVDHSADLLLHHTAHQHQADSNTQRTVDTFIRLI